MYSEEPSVLFSRLFQLRSSQKEEKRVLRVITSNMVVHGTRVLWDRKRRLRCGGLVDDIRQLVQSLLKVLSSRRQT